MPSPFLAQATDLLAATGTPPMPPPPRRPDGGNYSAAPPTQDVGTLGTPREDVKDDKVSPAPATTPKRMAKPPPGPPPEHVLKERDAELQRHPDRDGGCQQDQVRSTVLVRGEKSSGSACDENKLATGRHYVSLSDSDDEPKSPPVQTCEQLPEMRQQDIAVTGSPTSSRVRRKNGRGRGRGHCRAELRKVF